MDKLDFLDGSSEPNEEVVAETPVVEAPEAEAPAVEPEAAPVETEAQKRERDERGRFKAKDEQPQDQTMVPLTALHETRDKVRALEAELQRLRPQQQSQPEVVPDIWEDPEGYQNHLAQTVRQATLNATLNLSEELVRQSAGNETVDAAQQWGQQAFQANPALFQQFISQRNPYGFLVQEYQRQTALSKLGDPKDIDAFLAWKAAQAQIQQQPAQATPQPEAPPPSIASAPSAGGVQTIATGPGVAFSELIK
jgi:hypothetical protein